MVKLFRFNGTEWVFFDKGLKSLVDLYCAQGYLVQY